MNRLGINLPSWPPAARHIITGISKADRESYDENRVGPVYRIDGKWQWCNGGGGGHIGGAEDIHPLASGPLCTWCGLLKF